MNEPYVWLLTTIIIFISSAIQSMTGFGFAVLAVPLLVIFLNPRDVVALSMILSTLSVLAMAWRTRKHTRLPINTRLFTAAIFGLPPGLLALRYLDLAYLQIAVGLISIGVTLILVLSVVRSHESTLADEAEPGNWWSRQTIFAGLVSGFLTGSLSMPGPPVVALLSGQSVKKAAYRATLLAYLSLIYPLALIALVIGQLVSTRIFLISIGHIPALIIGIMVGEAVHEASTQRLFTIFSLVLLSVSGAIALWAGVASVVAL